jgi:hypothetical protein
LSLTSSKSLAVNSDEDAGMKIMFIVAAASKNSVIIMQTQILDIILLCLSLCFISNSKVNSNNIYIIYYKIKDGNRSVL